MKKKLILFLLILLISQFVHSEQKRIDKNVIDKHYGYLEVGCGYYSLLEQFDDLTTKGGFSAHFGGGYEFRYSYLWTSVGLQVDYWSSTASTREYLMDQRMLDTQGKPIFYHFSIDPSTETSYGLYAYVPVLIGFHVNGFYIGAGAKFGYSIFAKNKILRTYSTSATYEQYIADFIDMPNHSYANYEATNKEKLNIKIPLNLALELGYDVLANYSYSSYSRDKVLKIGLYAEYGLLNAFSNEKDDALFAPNQQHPSQLEVFSYYNHKATQHYRVVPFNAGLKVTIMFRIPTSSCNCK